MDATTDMGCAASPVHARVSAGEYKGVEIKFVDVWRSNIHEEFAIIRTILEKYPYVAMDTEFPGVVARPMGSFTASSTDYHYQTLRCNCDLLKIIQLGLSFNDENGIPEGTVWQFNFEFNLTTDMYAQDSIDLLQRSGIDFKDHEERGIDVAVFGELLMTSGIVLNDDVKWVSFHSGYDFGYLLKVLTCTPLPADEDTFFELLKTYFPEIFDIKFIMKYCDKLPGAENLKGGLNRLAEALQVERIGPMHQAGSDSLLTAATFFKVKSLFTPLFKINGLEELDVSCSGVLYGLGAGGKDAHRERGGSVDVRK